MSQVDAARQNPKWNSDPWTLRVLNALGSAQNNIVVSGNDNWRLDTVELSARNRTQAYGIAHKELVFKSGVEIGNVSPGATVRSIIDNELKGKLNDEDFKIWVTGFIVGRRAAGGGNSPERDAQGALLARQLAALRENKSLLQRWFPTNEEILRERAFASQLRDAQDPLMDYHNGQYAWAEGFEYAVYGKAGWNQNHGVLPDYTPLVVAASFGVGALGSAGGLFGGRIALSNVPSAVATGALLGAGGAAVDQTLLRIQGQQLTPGEAFGGLITGAGVGAAFGAALGFPGMTPGLGILDMTMGLQSAADAAGEGLWLNAAFRASASVLGPALTRRLVQRGSPRPVSQSSPEAPPSANTPTRASAPRTIAGNDSWNTPGLPARGVSDPTRGILEIGAQTVQLRSGGLLPQGAASNIPNLSASARAALGHVEGRAAALLRGNPNHSVGILRINYEGGPCADCINGIQEILAPGQILHVEYPLPNGNSGSGYFVGGRNGGWIQGPQEF